MEHWLFGNENTHAYMMNLLIVFTLYVTNVCPFGLLPRHRCLLLPFSITTNEKLVLSNSVKTIICAPWPVGFLVNRRDFFTDYCPQRILTKRRLKPEGATWRLPRKQGKQEIGRFWAMYSNRARKVVSVLLTRRQARKEVQHTWGVLRILFLWHKFTCRLRVGCSKSRYFKYYNDSIENEGRL